MLQRFTSTDWVEAMDSAGNIGFIHLNFCELVNSDIFSENNETESSYSINTEEGTNEPNQTQTIELRNLCFEGKPQRPAPPAPRRTSVFPTFNQFRFDEKQEILQLEMEQEQREVPAPQPNTSETHPQMTSKDKVSERLSEN